MGAGVSPNWDRLATLAAQILACPLCERWSSVPPPEPFWVGSDYRVGGIVLLARNPADKGGRSLPPEPLATLQRLRQSESQDEFRQWSEWRRRDTVNRPWKQWNDAFGPATRGVVGPSELAWLNVLPARTSGNARPTREQFDHGREAHLRPVLEALDPESVVWRYVEAGQALELLKSESRHLVGHVARDGRNLRRTCRPRTDQRRAPEADNRLVGVGTPRDRDLFLAGISLLGDASNIGVAVPS